MQDWLCQLLPYSPSLQSELKRHMEDDQRLDDISTDEFWHILLHAVAFIPRLYCVVDALDEMDISKLAFLDRLVELGKQQHSVIKVLMTSRPLPRIESILRTPSILQISILQIRLQQNMVDTDISIYANHRLQEHADVSLNDEIRKNIRNAICTKGQGSFLYARLMMDNLLDDTTQISSNGSDIEQLMKKIPASLEDTYNGMLLDHATRSGVPQELQLTILQWVTHSIRPLRLIELAAMIDSPDGTQRKSKDTKALVRTACGPLLEILEDETVSIIHHSFTEFLLDQGREERASTETGIGQFPVIKSTDTHQFLALTCLKYLTSGTLDGWKSVRRGRDGSLHPIRQEDVKMAHPFLDYAASNICAHVAKIGSSDKVVFAALDEFMKTDNQAFVSWTELAWPNQAVQKMSPLHIAAHEGILEYCQHLIRLGHDVNELDATLRTPISWASAKGHTNVVTILLENGANANPDDKAGLKPLHYAAQANHSEVVRLLLTVGVDPLTPRTKNYQGRRCGNAPSEIGVTAVQYACQGGCAETVIEFMKYLNTEELDRALCCAASAGKANVVITLLESPNISVDNMAWGATPLFYAARNHNPVVIKALLQKGADPNARSTIVQASRRMTARSRRSPLEWNDNRRHTPLHSILAGLNHRGTSSTLEKEDVLRECCKLLVDAGSDVNALGEDDRHPIHYSTSPAITSILLAYGAKATVTSRDGSTPLHFACEEGAHEDLIELLVRHGADINAKRQVDGKTPLHLMLTNSYAQYLKSFLAYKPDVNAEDNDENTPLHLAVQQYCRGINTVQILLDAGADPNKANINMESPIHMMRHGRMFDGIDVVPILLQAGADLEARDNLGHTVLLRSLTDLKAVKKLLDLGAKVGARDIYGNSVSHLICQNPFSQDILRLLVEAGADLTWVNHEGNTILHETSKPVLLTDHLTQVRFLEVLLQLGVAVAQKNYSGATPLHITCSSRPNSGSAQIWKAIIDLLLGPKFGIGINEGDNNGIRAIHLAATISEQLVHWLVDAGADPAVRTREGQTPLQVACRARQTNVVGMLLELYSKRAQSHLIDWKDKRGRTALHDACRSGRPESVKLLLDAGADPNVKDKKDYTPLHVCSEFIEENVIWSSRRALQEDSSMVRAANVLIGDSQRPVGPIPFRPHQMPFSMWDCQIQSEDDTVRIRESLRLLLAYGADVTALSQPNCTPLYIALCAGCEVMVDELLPATQKAFDENKAPLYYGWRADDAFAKQYLRLRSKHSPGILRNLVKEGEESFGWNKLLRLDDEVLFDELIKLQVDFFNQGTKRGALPATLAGWGYATLLEKFGQEVSMYHDPSRLEDFGKGTSCHFQPLLHIACHRELPNMDVIRILVDKLGVDVNARAILSGDSLTGDSALHVLASGQYWWQIQAVEYLLQRGAEIEMRNEQGETPLSVCVDNSSYRTGCWRNDVADMLLRHGANPNILDKKGLTCLNKAGSNIEMVRKLIKHGADINLDETPALFTAIGSYDLETVEAILDSGAGFNARRKASNPQQWGTIPASEIPPLHYAACSAHNTKTKKESALPVVRLLLTKGADPYEIINKNTTVVHDLFANGGILEPFLELPGLELEHRDPRGRTLFLAGCHFPYSSPGHVDFLSQLEENKPIVASLLYEMGADITVRDNNGMNALHFLLANRRDNESHKKTFKLFIKDAPLLVRQKNREGNTPLHYALRNLQAWPIEPLLSAGSDPVDPDSSGNTALHYLARAVTFSPHKSEKLQLFKKFFVLGVSINSKNKLGETPLFVYISSGPGQLDRSTTIREDITIFQDAGADFLARNNDMETLLHIAAKRVYNGLSIIDVKNKEDTVDRFKCLMEHGCDPLAEDINQRTALDVAAACGNDEILKLFKRDGKSKEPIRQEFR